MNSAIAKTTASSASASASAARRISAPSSAPANCVAGRPRTVSQPQTQPQPLPYLSGEPRHGNNENNAELLTRLAAATQGHVAEHINCLDSASASASADSNANANANTNTNATWIAAVPLRGTINARMSHASSANINAKSMNRSRKSSAHPTVTSGTGSGTGPGLGLGPGTESSSMQRGSGVSAGQREGRSHGRTGAIGANTTITITGTGTNSNSISNSTARDSIVDTTSVGSSSSSGIGSATSGSAHIDYDYFKKVYTDWVNHHLQKIASANAGSAPRSITDLEHDLRDGIVLARIIELIANQKLPKLSAKPRNGAEMVGNLTTCLEFLQSNLQIQLADITPVSIFEGDLKSILRLLFALSQFKKQQIQQQKAALNSSSSSSAAGTGAETNTHGLSQSQNQSHPSPQSIPQRSNLPMAAGQSIPSGQTRLPGLTPSRSSSSTISSSATGIVSNATTTSTTSATSASSSSGVQSKTTSMSSSNTTSIHSDDSLLSDANNNNTVSSSSSSSNNNNNNSNSGSKLHHTMPHAHSSNIKPPSVQNQHPGTGVATLGRQPAGTAGHGSMQHASSTNSCSTESSASAAPATPMRMGADGQPIRGAIIVKPQSQVQSSTMPSKLAQPTHSSNNTLTRQRSMKAKQHSQSAGPHTGSGHTLQISSTSARSSRSSSRSTSPSASTNNLRESGLSSTLGRHNASSSVPLASRIASPSGSRLPTATSAASKLGSALADSHAGAALSRHHPPTHIVKPSSKSRCTPASIAATKPLGGSQLTHGHGHASRSNTSAPQQHSGIPVVTSGGKKSIPLQSMQTNLNGGPASDMQVEDLLRGEQPMTAVERTNSEENRPANDNIDTSKLVTFTPKMTRTVASSPAPSQLRSPVHYANVASVPRPNAPPTAVATASTTNTTACPDASAADSMAKPPTITSSTQCENSFLKREARKERHRSAERQTAAVAAAATADKPVSVAESASNSITPPKLAQPSTQPASLTQLVADGNKQPDQKQAPAAVHQGDASKMVNKVDSVKSAPARNGEHQFGASIGGYENACSFDTTHFSRAMITSTDSIDDDENFLDFNNGSLRSTKSPYSHLRVLSNGLGSGLSSSGNANANASASANSNAVTINGQIIPNLRLNLTRMYAERKRLNTIEEQEPRDHSAVETDSCLSDAESSAFQNGYTSDGDLLKPLGTVRQLSQQNSVTLQNGYSSDYSGYVSEGGLSWYSKVCSSKQQKAAAAGAQNNAVSSDRTAQSSCATLPGSELLGSMTDEEGSSRSGRYLKAGMNLTKLVQDLRNRDDRGQSGSMTSTVRDLKNAFRELRSHSERRNKADFSELDSFDEASSWSSDDCLDSTAKDKTGLNTTSGSRKSSSSKKHNYLAGWEAETDSLINGPTSNRRSLNLQKPGANNRSETEDDKQLSVSTTADSANNESDANNGPLTGLLSPGSIRPSRLSLPTFSNIPSSMANLQNSSSSSHNPKSTSTNASQISLNSMNGATLSASISKSGLDNAESHSTCSSSSMTQAAGMPLQQDVEVKRLRRDLEHAYDKVSGLTRQLQANAQIVHSFEETLKTMQSRIFELTDSSDQKENELSQLRSLLTQLKEHQVALQSSVNPNSTGTVSTQPDLLSDTVSVQDISLRDYLNNSSSRLSVGSIHSLSNQLASGANSDTDQQSNSGSSNRFDRKQKKGWLISSFGKAFNKKKHGTSYAAGTDTASVHSLQVDPYYVNVGPASAVNTLHNSPSRLPVSPMLANRSGHSSAVHHSEKQAADAHNADAISTTETVDSDVEFLKEQLKEKDLKLTDAQLEALTTTHQLEQLKQMMVRMKVEMQTLKSENERLNSMLNQNMRKLGDAADLLSIATQQGGDAADDQFEIPCVDLSASNTKCSLAVGVSVGKLCDGAGLVPSGATVNDMVLIGNVLIDVSTSWYELDAAICTLFRGYIDLLDSLIVRMPQSRKNAQSSPKLGLSESSIRAYIFGMIQREAEDNGAPAESPFQTASNCRIVRIQLHGFRIAENDDLRGPLPLDQFAFETLIPKSILERYVVLVNEHKRVIFSGPPGTGKTFLTKRLAELLAIKHRRAAPACAESVALAKAVESPTDSQSSTNSLGSGQITCFVVDQKSHKELRQFLTHLTDKCFFQLGVAGTQSPTTPTDPQNVTNGGNPASSLPQILILDNLHQLSQNVNEVLRSVAAVPHEAGFYLLGTMHNVTSQPGSAAAPQSANSTGAHLSTCLEVHHNFRWIISGNHLEPTRSLLNRYLRRKLIDSEVRLRMSSATPNDTAHQERWRLLNAVQRWTVQLWFTLNRLLESACCADVTIGPRIFLACPFDDPRNSQSWFTDLWNYSIFPYLLNAVRDSPKAGVTAGGDAIEPCSIADEAFNWICQTYPWPTPNDFSFLMRLRNAAQDDFSVDTISARHNVEQKYEIHV